MMTLIPIFAVSVAAIVAVVGLLLIGGFRIAREFERGVIFRFGRHVRLRGQVLYWIAPPALMISSDVVTLATSLRLTFASTRRPTPSRRPDASMHVPTHILSGWIVGNALPLGPRGRLNCMIAASVADVDGLGIVFGQQTYWRFHHTAGHNVFFGLFVAGVLTAVTPARRGLAFAAYLACFHLHLLMDYYGSGPGWTIQYLWPIDHTAWRTIYAWELSSWQNRVAFGVLLAITVAIAWRARRTPLELIAPRLDSLLLTPRRR